MHRPVLTCIVALVTIAQSPLAQTSGSVDVGTAFLNQPTIGSSSVLTAAGDLSYLTSRTELSIDGVAARTPNDLYTGQAVLRAARYAPPFRRARWELAASGSGYGVSGLAPSLGGQLLAREHLGSTNAGGFAGVTAGTVGQAGVWQRVLGAHAGGFVRLGANGNEQLSGAMAYTDATPPAGFGSAVRYADLFGYWSHQGGPFELLVGGGARTGLAGALGTSGWASGAATLWLTPRLAVVVSAGRALSDVTRAVPSVRYVSFALRLGQQHTTPTIELPPHRAGEDRIDGHLDVRATGDSTRLITVHADSARAVELMADFTDWEAVSLVKMPNGDWTLARPIVAGVHHVAIRIDGGTWRAPPNLTRAADDFGGEVGLLAVP